MEKGFSYILTNKNCTVLYVGASKKISKTGLIVIVMEPVLLLQKSTTQQF